MDKSDIRMTQPEHPPSDMDVKGWIGDDAYKYWVRISSYIEEQYPNVFTPEWLFGGKKQGWSVRYKKSRSFCTLIPEKNHIMLQIVFGAKERKKVESIRDSLTKKTQIKYDEAKTYHDGKWLYLSVDSDDVVKDILILLTTKRKPNKKNV